MKVDLSKSMLLLDVEVRRWTGNLTDRQVSEEVLTAKHMDRSSGRFVKKLLPKAFSQKLQRAESAIRRFVDQNTITWFGNMRMFPASQIFDMKTQMDELVAAYNNEVAAIVAQFDDVREYAQRLLGDTFNPHEFPTAGEFDMKNSAMYQFVPLPHGDNLKLAVSDEYLHEVRHDYETKLQSFQKEATEQFEADVLSTIAGVTERVIDDTLRTPRNFAAVANELNKLVKQIPYRHLSDSSVLDEKLPVIQALSDEFEYFRDCYVHELPGQLWKVTLQLLIDHGGLTEDGIKQRIAVRNDSPLSKKAGNATDPVPEVFRSLVSTDEASDQSDSASDGNGLSDNLHQSQHSQNSEQRGDLLYPSA